jgi:hypothetical protein
MVWINRDDQAGLHFCRSGLTTQASRALHLEVFGEVAAALNLQHIHADVAVVQDHHVISGRAASRARVARGAEEVESAIGVADPEAMARRVGLPGDGRAILQFHRPAPTVSRPGRATIALRQALIEEGLFPPSSPPLTKRDRADLS